MSCSAPFFFLRSFASSVFCKFQSFLSVSRHWQWLHRLKIYEGQNSAAWTCSETVEVFSWDGARGNSGPLRVGYISPDFYSHSASTLPFIEPGISIGLVHRSSIGLVQFGAVLTQVSYFIHSALKYHDPAFVAVTCRWPSTLFVFCLFIKSLQCLHKCLHMVSWCQSSHFLKVTVTSRWRMTKPDNSKNWCRNGGPFVAAEMMR